MSVRVAVQWIPVLAVFVATGCGPSAAPPASTTSSAPVATPSMPLEPPTSPAQVQVWCGFMNYDKAAEGLKAGDTAKFVGTLSPESTANAVIVQSSQRFTEEFPGVDYKSATAAELIKAVADNHDEAIKTYRGEEGKVPLMLIVEGTIERLEPSEYKIFLKKQ